MTVDRYKYTMQEVATALVKQQGIHEGLWGVIVQFGIGASNIGPNENELSPAAIVPIIGFGLQRFEKPSNLTVDAEKVNPKSK